MTEPEWLSCIDPKPMLEFLRGEMILTDVRIWSGRVVKMQEYPKDKLNDRKLRLFTAACCKILETLFPDPRHLDWIKRVELSAMISDMPEELAALQVEAFMATRPDFEKAEAIKNWIAWAKSTTGETMARHVTRQPPMPPWARKQEAKLVHDIFGNPFHPLPPRPEAIAPLAERIYAGEWNAMPLLGQWLQKRGYVDEAEHCLDPNIHHVKGCWVVDWVTGRE
jgi:hypothetical protein